MYLYYNKKVKKFYVTESIVEVIFQGDILLAVFNEKSPRLVVKLFKFCDNLNII